MLRCMVGSWRLFCPDGWLGEPRPLPAPWRTEQFSRLGQTHPADHGWYFRAQSCCLQTIKSLCTEPLLDGYTGLLLRHQKVLISERVQGHLQSWEGWASSVQVCLIFARPWCFPKTQKSGRQSGRERSRRLVKSPFFSQGSCGLWGAGPVAPRSALVFGLWRHWKRWSGKTTSTRVSMRTKMTTPSCKSMRDIFRTTTNISRNHSTPFLMTSQ